LFNECFYQLGVRDPEEEVAPEAAWKSVYEHVLKAAGSLSTMYKSSTARIDIEFIRNNEYKDKMKLATNLKGLKEFLLQVSLNNHIISVCLNPLQYFSKVDG